ncbi:MAG: hypothetical protein COZ70_13660 [Deltaproteobacteria bacterium CG_4_8_14_3_um_filter_51_11]|nr:MAG: hypothetical protein COZ70_13660 [Deltaproteobacteria bacterium CG_4_8_14_3_um_filter_51_11]PIY23218.1 MAG: hypothetical protein COZ11_10070 [Deltaproteobacteria bacterium CG_4_10_14_3_um_filter_51_14]PJB38536.1 MAG: hypothetical protein CO107_02225 [Deltaproteobacteria bacterium CG_4_9_14_3_um_filter_51_14]
MSKADSIRNPSRHSGEACPKPRSGSRNNAWIAAGAEINRTLWLQAFHYTKNLPSLKESIFVYPKNSGQVRLSVLLVLISAKSSPDLLR